MQPSFIVIGAAKCGTTSLCHLLDQHPDVAISKRKEPDYFTAQYHRGWPWYESKFAHCRHERAIGEGSVSYSWAEFYPQAAARIAKDLPEAKLIYIVRHPIERIQSHWIEDENNGKNPGPLNQAVRSAPRLLEASRYWQQISRYREHFGDDRILVLFFEDFKANPTEVLDRCFSFIGVEAGVAIELGQPQRNSWTGKHQDTPALKFMRRWAWFARLRDANASSGPVRSMLRKILKQPITERPKWDQDTLAWVIDQIGQETKQFLEFYEKPADYWNLAAKAT